jgi:hypothetical protein
MHREEKHMANAQQIRRMESKQVVGWCLYAHRRRMAEGVTGAWWELIPEEQQAAAKAWVQENLGSSFDSIEGDA